MENIKLQPNHKRSFSSSIYLLEKLVEEVREVLTSDRQLLMQEIETDLDDGKRRQTLDAVDEIDGGHALLTFQVSINLFSPSSFLISETS